MTRIILLLLLLPIFLKAQTHAGNPSFTGVDFKTETNWQQVKEMAAQEGKLIFVYCFGAQNVYNKVNDRLFAQENVGDYINQHFISIKLQMDQTAFDNEETISWYPTSRKLAQTFGIRKLPTYLFFTADGGPLHIDVNGASTDSGIIAMATDAADTGKQYYTAVKKIKAGYSQPDFLKAVALKAIGVFDLANATLLSAAYLETQPDIFTTGNIGFITQFLYSSQTKSFDILLNHPEKIDSVLGKNFSDGRVLAIMKYEAIASLTNGNGYTGEPAWEAIRRKMQKRYPQKSGAIEQYIHWSKLSYYQTNGDWYRFFPTAMVYMDSYTATVPASEASNYANAFFTNSNDAAQLNKALAWSKNCCAQDSANATYLHTYANLLYKTGHKKEAIMQEGKAIALAADNEKYNFEEALDKMKNGIETW